MNGNLFYSFDQNENPDHYLIFSLKLSKEVNTLSTLSFTTLITHPNVSSIKIKKTVFILADDNLCLFIGKASSISKNILNGTVELEVEDMLGCMRDRIAVDGPLTTYTDEEGNTKTVHLYTYRELLNLAMVGMTGYGDASMSLPQPTLSIINGSSDMSAKLSSQIIQEITGTDRLSIIYNTVNPLVHGILTSKVTGSYSISGGYPKYIVKSYVVKYSCELNDNNAYRDENGYLYYGRNEINNIMNDISFDYGYNIINSSFEASNKEPFTEIMAYGTFKYGSSSQEYIASRMITQNDFSPIRNITLKYGTIQKAVNFGFINEYPNISGGAEAAAKVLTELLDKATSFLADKMRLFCDNCVINGIDPYFIKESNKGIPIDICDTVRIRPSNDLELDYSEYCLSLEIDFFNHENDRYVIGPYIPENMLEYSVAQYYK